MAFPDTGCPGAVIREPCREARRLPLVRRTGYPLIRESETYGENLLVVSAASAPWRTCAMRQQGS